MAIPQCLVPRIPVSDILGTISKRPDMQHSRDLLKSPVRLRYRDARQVAKRTANAVTVRRRCCGQRVLRVHFSVTATGTAPLAYQWKKNDTAIGGATNAAYTTAATTSADNGAKPPRRDCEPGALLAVRNRWRGAEPLNRSQPKCP